MSKKKKKVNVRELVNQFQENCERINAIADACENEQRERTEQEEAEYGNLLRDNQLLQMRMQAAINAGGEAEARSVSAQLREALNEAMENGSRNPVMLTLTREIQTTAALEGTGIIPVNDQEMLAPLRDGLI